MINSVQIEKFRTFERFKIDGLTQVNLIAGKNNVGKSSLLDAIYLLVHYEPMQALRETIYKRCELIERSSPSNLDKPNERGSSRESIWDISDLFWGYKYDTRTFNLSYRTESRPRNFTLLVADSTKLILDAPPNRTPQLSLDLWKTIEIETEDEFVLRLPQSISRSRYRTYKRNVYFIPTEGLKVGTLGVLWDRINLTSDEEYVNNMLRLLEPRLSRISFQTSTRDVLIKLEQVDKPISIQTMGDGIQHLLGIAIAMASLERGGFLLIDEIDTGIHYRVMTDLWKIIIHAAKEREIQIFATTHSLDCVHAFAEALDELEDYDIGAYFRLQRRGEKGEIIQSERYDGEILNRAVEHGVEVR